MVMGNEDMQRQSGAARLGGRAAILLAASAFFIAPAIFVAPAMAAPSQDNDDPPVAGAGVVSFPMVNGRGWQLNAGVSTRYDTNISRFDGGDGFRITPQVQGGVGIPLGRQDLFFGGMVGRDFILGNDRIPNRNRFAAGGGVNWRLGQRCDGQIAGEYRQSLALFSEQIGFEDNVQSVRTIGGSANCRIGGAFGITGNVRYTDLQNSAPIQRLFGNRGTSFTAGLTYGRPALGQFSLTGSLDQRVFPNRPVLDTTATIVNDGVDIISARLGYQRGLGSRLTVGAGVSYLTVKPQPSQQVVLIGDGLGFVVDRPSFSGVGFDGTLVLRAGTGLTLSLAGNRRAQSSANLGALYTLTTAISADVAYRLGRAITVSAGGSFVRNDYRGSFANELEGAARVNDKFERIYGQIGYQAGRLIDVTFEIAHQRRDSNPAIFSFSSTTALLSLRASFGRTQ